MADISIAISYIHSILTVYMKRKAIVIITIYISTECDTQKLFLVLIIVLLLLFSIHEHSHGSFIQYSVFVSHIDDL